MTCLIHIYYCFIVLVNVPDTLSTIMLHVYVVTLSGTCYTFYYRTLLCIPCIVLFHIFFVHIPFLYTHDTITRFFMIHTDTVRLLLWYPQSCHLYTLLHFLIFVTLYVVTQSCICILCIAYILLYVYIVAFITVYVQHSSMVVLHTAHLHVHFHHVITIQQYVLYKTGYYCRHDPMINAR